MIYLLKMGASFHSSVCLPECSSTQIFIVNWQVKKPQYVGSFCDLSGYITKVLGAPYLNLGG